MRGEAVEWLEENRKLLKSFPKAKHHANLFEVVSDWISPEHEQLNSLRRVSPL